MMILDRTVVIPVPMNPRHYRVLIKTRGCPWDDIEQSQFHDFPKGKHGWNPLAVKGWGRYGGFWTTKIGIELGSSTAVINFGLGSLRMEVRRG